MKKPLLLLIDDDRSVLDALEAELHAEFAEICRIEAFDDPEDALAALPRWSAEGRSIAVAVVDQKMPGMSGVELLVALRSAESAAPATASPSRHMRALLLTGYAGLDSALAAKNEAGVDGYLEKPWRQEELRAAIRRALAASLSNSGLDEHFIYRQLVSDDEIRAVLELRYLTYSATPAMSRVLPKGATLPLDVDAYDAYSTFLGLFTRDRDSRKLVGALRIVGDEETSIAPAVRAIVSEDKMLASRATSSRPSALPLLDYLVDREAAVAVLETMRLAGERVVEPGRLVLSPAWRSSTDSGARHLARHIIEGAVAFCFHFQVQNAMVFCVPAHAAFYGPYGFRETEGTTTRFHPTVGSERICIHGRIDWVPSPARERCQSLATRIARTGAACRCASFPDCLGGPYETGNFSPVDLFCPLLAGEITASTSQQSS